MIPFTSTCLQLLHQLFSHHLSLLRTPLSSRDFTLTLLFSHRPVPKLHQTTSGRKQRGIHRVTSDKPSAGHKWTAVESVLWHAFECCESHKYFPLSYSLHQQCFTLCPLQRQCGYFNSQHMFTEATVWTVSMKAWTTEGQMVGLTCCVSSGQYLHFNAWGCIDGALTFVVTWLQGLSNPKCDVT